MLEFDVGLSEHYFALFCHVYLIYVKKLIAAHHHKFTRRNYEWRFCHRCDDFRRPASSFVVVHHHKSSGSNISRTVWRRTTKFHTDIHADLVYNHSGYDVTSKFRSALFEVLTKTAKNAASDVFVSNFSGAAFCLAQPIGGLLVFILLSMSGRRSPIWGIWETLKAEKLIGFCTVS